MRFGLGIQIGGILAIAVYESSCQALFDPRKQVFDRDYLDNPLHLRARYQPQSDVDDDAEEAITANRQGKKLLVLVAAAILELAVGGEQ